MWLNRQTLVAVSVEDIDAGGDVLEKPVEAMEQAVAGVGAAADDLPVPVLVHHFKIQNLDPKTQLGYHRTQKTQLNMSIK